MPAGQRRYRPSVFVVFLNVQAMSLNGSFESQVVVIAVVAYVLDAMDQIIEVAISCKSVTASSLRRTPVTL